MAEAGTLTVTITGDTSSLVSALATAGAKVEAFSGETAVAAEAASGSFNDAAKAVGALVTTLGEAKVAADIFGALKDSVTIAGQLEQNKLAFQNMTGSAQEAADIMVKLSDFSKKTPFNLTEIEAGAKQLMAFGVPGDQLVQKLTLVGDAASRMNVPMQQAIDVWQEAQAGIFNSRIYAPLGVTREELAKFGDAFDKSGKQVDSSQLLPALEKLWGSSGRAGAMAVQMGTLNGMMINLGDQVSRAAGEIGGFDSTTGTLVQGGLLDRLQQQLSKIGQWVDEHQGQIRDLANTIGTNLANAFSTLVDWVKTAYDWMTKHQELIKTFAVLLGGALVGALVAINVAAAIAIGAFLGVSAAITSGSALIGAAIALTIANWIKWKDNFKTVVDQIKSFIDDLIKKFESIPSAVSNSLNGIAGKTASAVGGLGNEVGSAINHLITGKAAGGPVSSNTPYMVGENGPELFVPSTAGSIRPNGGSSTMNQSVSVNIGSVSLGGSMDVNRFAQELGRQIQAKLMGAVAY